MNKKAIGLHNNAIVEMAKSIESASRRQREELT